MDGAVWGFIGVVVGGLITGLVTIFAESIRADKAAALDGAKRQDDRQIGRDAFQRQNLLDLQVALAAFGRAEGKANFADTMSLRETGGLRQYPDDISAEMFEANRQLAFLTERVSDDDLRGKINAMRARSSQRAVLMSAEHGSVTEARLDREMMELMEMFVDAQERLGTVLRSLL
jgi:hypothetical protein